MTNDFYAIAYMGDEDDGCGSGGCDVGKSYLNVMSK